MIYEKSCGAVIYFIEGTHRLYLVEHMKKGHYALCKGHVEGSESEIQTAVREISEETSLKVKIDESFRECVEYSPYEGCTKTVVYFTARSEKIETQAQLEEVTDILWLELSDAMNILTYENDKEILRKADDFLMKAFIAGNIR